jgi:hypothetical protein
MHTTTIKERILTPADGLLLGNGDLSVSIYQTFDAIVWRFGKGDVWDRRLDLSRDPKPAHIDEIARGIRDEGWKCGPYGGPVEATRGTTNPQRMKELCMGCPPSYEHRPFPCPKPVGELALRFPPDQTGFKIVQHLRIEKAEVDIRCEWDSGLRLRVKGFIPPQPNVLVVNWEIENWTDATCTGIGHPPVWFCLYRWPDPPVGEFRENFYRYCRHRIAACGGDGEIAPLPPPGLRQADGQWLIEQAFPPDPTFPAGFRCVMAPFLSAGNIEALESRQTTEARLHLRPDSKAVGGALAVAVATAGGADAEVGRVKTALAAGFDAAVAAWEKQNRRSAREFWSRSQISLADPLLDDLWHETLHTRRCAFRAGTVPPGLFLPSTLLDYSHWHGDYHTNYNLESPYWGDYPANHFELGDAFFDAMEYLLQIGRKIARDYYGCRGAFVQLTGYPIHSEEDCLGVAPMGRMAYMTGWVVSHYWMRYRYSLDAAWLRARGYPVIRDCALFYTDFLKKGEDGLYHAFPSNQGEDGFTGKAEDYTDAPQVILHCRYCLRVALAAAAALDTDPDLRRDWQERLERLAPPRGFKPEAFDPETNRRIDLNPPEFTHFMGTAGGKKSETATSDNRIWYFGCFPWRWLTALRLGWFQPERDFAPVQELVRRWRRPNGVCQGMTIAYYGPAGIWSEALGVLGPLQELLLQSWDNAIHVLPAWPRELDGSFRGLRAEGAFLVSAEWAGGKIKRIEIASERGGTCRLRAGWPGSLAVQDKSGQPVKFHVEEGDVIVFETQPGQAFCLAPE